MNGLLFFVANDGSTGIELWKHDPATGMTEQIADLLVEELKAKGVGLGAVWWAERELEEKKSRMPGYKGRLLSRRQKRSSVINIAKA